MTPHAGPDDATAPRETRAQREALRGARDEARWAWTERLAAEGWRPPVPAETVVRQVHMTKRGPIVSAWGWGWFREGWPAGAVDLVGPLLRERRLRLAWFEAGSAELREGLWERLTVFDEPVPTWGLVPPEHAAVP